MRMSTAGIAPLTLPGLRLNRALLFSLLVHGLVLSLTFGGDGAGLPGMGLPQQAGRAELTDLRVVLNPDVVAPMPAALPEPEVLAPAPSREAEPARGDKAAEVVPPPPPVDAPAVLAVERPVAAAWAVPAASAASAVPTPVVAAFASAANPAVERLTRPSEPRPATSEREAGERTAELARVDAERQQIKAAPAVLSAASGPAVQALRPPAPATRAPVEIDARERSAELAQLDAARLQIRSAPVVLSAASAPAVEALRRASDTLRPIEINPRERSAELASLDAARQDVMQGVQRAEAARAESLRQEAARAEAARQEAARAEAGRQTAARQEAGRLEAARQEGVRIEAARLAAAQAQAQAQAHAEEEQREARKRAIGHQLDEEAAKREAQRDAERKRPDWVPARRGRLLGRIDPNAELTAYGETWSRKIESNLTTETVRDVARQPHTDAVVTVAVRSNGSVESITFVRSSGVPAVDEAITRIVRSQENYPAFQPALLRDFDFVEIRRTWHIDMAVRLY